MSNKYFYADVSIFDKYVEPFESIKIPLRKIINLT